MKALTHNLVVLVVVLLILVLLVLQLNQHNQEILAHMDLVIMVQRVVQDKDIL